MVLPSSITPPPTNKPIPKIYKIQNKSIKQTPVSKKSKAGRVVANFLKVKSTNCSILVYQKNACIVFLLYLDDVTNAI